MTAAPNRVALATCAELPAGDEDADALLAAFDRAGVTASWQVWDDPDTPWHAFDRTVIRSTWDYTPRRAEFLAWARRVPHLVNPADVVAWSSDKAYLAELAGAGLPTVATTFLPPGPSGLPVTGDVVLKPSVGAGSLGAGRFRLPAEAGDAERHLRMLHDAGRTVLVQDYVAAIDTTGETSLVCLGGAASHAARKTALLAPGARHDVGRSIEGGEHRLYIAETMATATPSGAELDVAARTLAWLRRRFGVVPPYARVDLLPGADGPVVIELELVEPSLFLAYAPDPVAAADRFVSAVLAGPDA